MNQLQVIVHDNRRVLTTAQLAESYGTDPKVISKNFVRNSGRYTIGKHFICLTGEELRTFRANRQIDELPSNINRFYLWTEKGAWLHAKSLNTDAAWDAYEMLVDEYYNIAEQLTEEQKAREHLKLSIMTSERMEKVENQVHEVKETVQTLFNTMRIDGVQEHAIRSQGQAKALEVLGGYESPAYKVVGKKVFTQLWRDFKNYFHLPRYGELPKSKFDEGVHFISKWHPSTAMEIEIEACNKQAQLKLVQ